MNKIIMRLLVLLGILSLTACGLPGAAVRSLGTVGRTGESLGRTLARVN
jgi:hypothetical protein